MRGLVLIANTDSKRTERVRRLVDGEGAETVLAADPCEAMRLFVLRKPDLTLLHTVSSDSLDIALCRDMKSLAFGRSLAVVVIGPRRARAAAFDAGCDAFIDLRHDEGPLVRSVQRFLTVARRPLGAISVSAESP